jgi:hypothetical protein
MISVQGQSLDDFVTWGITLEKQRINRTAGRHE